MYDTVERSLKSLGMFKCEKADKSVLEVSKERVQWTSEGQARLTYMNLPHHYLCTTWYSLFLIQSF